MRRRKTPLEPIIDAIEGTAALDATAKAAGKRVRATFSPGTLKDALSGTWLGHALHPLLTDVVVGSSVSATLLDVLGADADGAAQRRLIGVGIAAYLPTALTGANDWADAEPVDDGVRRSGVVHGRVGVAQQVRRRDHRRRRGRSDGDADGRRQVHGRVADED